MITITAVVDDATDILIETYWNVNMMTHTSRRTGMYINRDILECK